MAFKLNKQMEIFSFPFAINFSEEGNWFLAAKNSEATNSVFIINDDINTFSVLTPSHWSFKYGEKTIDKLNKILSVRSQIDLALHVEEVEKSGLKITKSSANINHTGIDKFSSPQWISGSDVNGI